jgi:hypothetical protein
MAIVLSPMVSAVIAAMQNQSVSSSPSAVEGAARTHRNLFIGYLVWIVFAALVSAFFTWMVWRSGNRQQDAAISETNERAARLEKDAAEARTRQAEAERMLLEIQERFAPRTLIREQRDAFVKRLSDAPKGKVEVWVTMGDPEAYAFSSQLWNALKDVGFDVGSQLTPFTEFGPPPVGVTIQIRDKDNVPPSAEPIQRALEDAGIKAGGEVSLMSHDASVVYIRVGIKPTP